AGGGPFFYGCQFVGNRATAGNGGAIASPSVQAQNCTFVANQAVAGSGGGIRGAVRIRDR
ncbi:MAG: hypothetical protein ABL878_08100, partial [Burkholderiales bacterium]